MKQIQGLMREGRNLVNSLHKSMIYTRKRFSAWLRHRNRLNKGWLPKSKSLNRKRRRNDPNSLKNSTINNSKIMLMSFERSNPSSGSFKRLPTEICRWWKSKISLRTNTMRRWFMPNFTKGTSWRKKD